MIKNIKIIIATLRAQAQAEKVYLGDFWSSLGSTGFYTIMFIIFIDLLFQRAGAIAGYSKNDFFFMMLVSQVSFYVAFFCIFSPLLSLIERVRNGGFDLALLKPVPTRSFLYCSSIKPILFALTAIPNAIIYCFLIDWGDLNFTLSSVAIGLVIWLCGMILYNTLLFIFTLPVFIVGEATDVISIFWSITSMSQFPYAKLPTIMKILGLGLLPCIVATAATTAVILNKVNIAEVIVPVLIATLFSIGLLNTLWRLALKNYTSASS